MHKRWKWILIGAATVMALCTMLPWWARNGATLSGYGGRSLGNPGWVIVVCALLIVGAAFLRVRWRDYLLPWPIVVSLIMTLGHLWRAYKLGALGWGLPLMLVAVLTAACAAFFLARERESRES